MTPDLTIGIPTRNRREHLTSLLRRIDAIDDGRSYQVVIVDEQSSDDTPDLLARWRPRRADVTVVRHDNPMGVCGARNRIIEHAQAPYVSWIDDDDLPAPTRYGRQLDELRRTGFRWSAVGSVNIDADNVVTGHVACPPLEGAALQAALLQRNIMPVPSGGLVVETEFARELGGFDESLPYIEDWDFTIRAALADPRVAFVDEPLLGYRIVHGTSLSSHTDRMFQWISAVFAKHQAAADRLGVDLARGELQANLLAYDLRVSRAAGRRRALRMAQAQPTLPYVVRAAAVCAAPHAYRKLGDMVRDRAVPGAWRTQAREWLGIEPPELDVAPAPIREPLRPTTRPAIAAAA